MLSTYVGIAYLVCAVTNPLPTSRPPIARMLKIHEALQDQRFVNCTKLAQELEVSTKTISRDLAFMKDRLDLPVDYQPELKAWRYSHPVTNFPMVQITEGELFALLIAQKALDQYKGTPFYGQLVHAFDKLSSGLRDAVTFSNSSALSNVSFHNLGFGKADMRNFELLTKAVREFREVTFSYQKPQAQVPEQRRVQPYHIANREHAWYLVGFDGDRKAIRHFALGRMAKVTVTKTPFVRPADFSPEKHFERSFGAYVGQGDHRVVIRFTQKVAARITERFWHESQETKSLPDGGIEMSVHLNSLEDIHYWVLSWGAAAKVIRPKELVESVRRAAAEMVSNYSE